MGVGENLSKGSGDMWNYSFLRNGENLHQEKVVQDKWSKKDLKSRAWFFVEMPIPSKSSSPKEGPCEVQPWYFHFFVERVTNKRRLQVSNNVIGLFGKVSAQNLDKHSFQNKSAKVHWQKDGLLIFDSMTKHTPTGESQGDFFWMTSTVLMEPRLSSHNENLTFE